MVVYRGVAVQPSRN